MAISEVCDTLKSLRLPGKVLAQLAQQRQTRIHRALCNNTLFGKYMCGLSRVYTLPPNFPYLACIQRFGHDYASAEAEVEVLVEACLLEARPFCTLHRTSQVTHCPSKWQFLLTGSGASGGEGPKKFWVEAKEALRLSPVSSFLLLDFVLSFLTLELFPEFVDLLDSKVLLVIGLGLVVSFCRFES